MVFRLCYSQICWATLSLKDPGIAQNHPIAVTFLADHLLCSILTIVYLLKKMKVASSRMLPPIQPLFRLKNIIP
jgi:hypothetical protein